MSLGPIPGSRGPLFTLHLHFKTNMKCSLEAALEVSDCYISIRGLVQFDPEATKS